MNLGSDLLFGTNRYRPPCGSRVNEPTMVRLGTSSRWLSSWGANSEGCFPPPPKVVPLDDDFGGRMWMTLLLRWIPSDFSWDDWLVVTFLDFFRRLMTGSQRLICTSSSCHISASSSSSPSLRVSSFTMSNSSLIKYSSSSYSTSPISSSVDCSILFSFWPPPSVAPPVNFKLSIKSAIVTSFCPLPPLSSPRPRPPPSSSPSSSPTIKGCNSTNTYSPSNARFRSFSSFTNTSFPIDPRSHVTNAAPFLDGMTRILPRTTVASWAA
mmetsp:Transcript_28401/g.60996  ORF Transcript_28401/g.60996 Transcript_28401/m.60996 type:complete len:267 (-) Transcript_28401:945-1745(-)